MIVVPIKEGENIEKSLKKFKRKFEETHSIRLVKDDATGEVYLTGFAKYYNKLQSSFKSYPEFERYKMKRFLKTTSKSVRANFSNL